MSTQKTMTTTQIKCSNCKQGQSDSCPSIWCFECGLGLCDNCKATHTAIKATRSHFTLPFTGYLQTPKTFHERLKWSQTCYEHRHSFSLYCKRHQVVCCPEGVAKIHNECRDFCTVEQLYRKNNWSNTLNEIKKKINEMDDNIKPLIGKCQTQKDILFSQSQLVEIEIEQSEEDVSGTNLLQTKNNQPVPRTDLPQTKDNEPVPRTDLPQAKDGEFAARTDLPQTKDNEPVPRTDLPQAKNGEFAATTDLPQTKDGEYAHRTDLPLTKDRESAPRNDLPHTKDGEVAPNTNLPQTKDSESVQKTDLTQTKDSDFFPRIALTQWKDNEFIVDEAKTDRSQTSIEVTSTELHQTELRQIRNILVEELKEITKTGNNRLLKIEDSLKKYQKKFRDLRKTFEILENLSFNRQTILAVWAMAEHTADIIKAVNSLKDCDILQSLVLSCDVKNALHKLKLDNERKGHVRLTSPNCSACAIAPTKGYRTLANTTSKNIEDIKLKRNLTIRIYESNMRGCFILPDGRMLISLWGVYALLVIKVNGSEDFRVNMRPVSPYDISYMETDKLVVAATYESIAFIDLQERAIIRTIHLGFESEIHSLSIFGSNIVFTGEEKGIQMIDLSTETVTTVVDEELPPHTYLTVFDDHIYYSNCETDEVTCYNMAGEEVWKFLDEDILQCPLSLSVDSSGNVYVVGKNSWNIVVLSPNGKHIKELLWRVDGLREPRIVSYNARTNQILFANDQNYAYLYDVT